MEHAWWSMFHLNIVMFLQIHETYSHEDLHEETFILGFILPLLASYLSTFSDFRNNIFITVYSFRYIYIYIYIYVCVCVCVCVCVLMAFQLLIYICVCMHARIFLCECERPSLSISSSKSIYFWGLLQLPRLLLLLTEYKNTHALAELLEIELFWYLNCVLMQNWFVWNRTVFDTETVIYAKLIKKN